MRRAGLQSGNSGADAAIWKLNFFGKPRILPLKPSTDWIRPTHPVGGEHLKVN